MQESILVQQLKASRAQIVAEYEDHLAEARSYDLPQNVIDMVIAERDEILSGLDRVLGAAGAPQ